MDDGCGATTVDKILPTRGMIKNPVPNDIFHQLVQNIMHQQYQALHAEHVSTCKSSGGSFIHVANSETRGRR